MILYHPARGGSKGSSVCLRFEGLDTLANEGTPRTDGTDPSKELPELLFPCFADAA